MKKLYSLLQKDPVLVISGLLAVLSMFLVVPDREYIGYLDFHVLALLFCLMCVMNGYQEIGFFRQLAVWLLQKTGNTRQLTAVLVLLCFVLSMFITNDVALITFVPLTVLILNMAGQQKLMIYIVVLQTIAANLGSMLTPIGNPQNLYLYNLSRMSFGAFVLTLLPYSLISLGLLVLCFFVKKAEPVRLDFSAVGLAEAPSKMPSSGTARSNNAFKARPAAGGMVLYTILFVVCLLSVLHVLSWPVMLAASLLSLLVCNRGLLRKADYGLLLTFVFFFVFIGNMGRIPAVVSVLGNLLQGQELLVSVAASQVISNVPATVLLSGFTTDYIPLLIGVNLGGLGTLIASLASLISYKQYAATEGADKGKYLVFFTGMNVLFLAVLLLAAICL